MKAAAVILGFRRPDNLPSVIRGIRRQSMVEKIYVFHNHPSKSHVDGVINIFSEENFGCIARHAFSLLLDAERILFVDDDLELMADFSARFEFAARTAPYAVSGLTGVNINQKADHTPLYGSGGFLDLSPVPQHVDIVKGRVHLANKQHLINSFQFITDNKGKIDGLREGQFIMDDVIINLASQLKTGKPSFLIPANAEELRNLNAPAGAHDHPEHYTIRHDLIREFLAKGWKPRALKAEYIKENYRTGGNDYASMLFQSLSLTGESSVIPIVSNVLSKMDMNAVPKLHLYRIAGIFRDNRRVGKAKQLYRYIASTSTGETSLKALSYYQLGILSVNSGHKIKAQKHLKYCLNLMPDHKRAALALRKI